MIVATIFISYNHRDEVWRNELVRHLRVLERGGTVRIWGTSEKVRINPGAKSFILWVYDVLARYRSVLFYLRSAPLVQ